VRGSGDELRELIRAINNLERLRLLAADVAKNDAEQHEADRRLA
jgi:hypothetical protein